MSITVDLTLSLGWGLDVETRRFDDWVSPLFEGAWRQDIGSNVPIVDDEGCYLFCRSEDALAVCRWWLEIKGKEWRGFKMGPPADKGLQVQCLPSMAVKYRRTCRYQLRMRGEKGLQRDDLQVDKETEMEWESSKGNVVVGGGRQSRELIRSWLFLPLGGSCVLRKNLWASAAKRR